LQLSLRRVGDDLAAATDPTTMADLRLYQDKPREAPKEAIAAPPEPEPRFRIRTMRGLSEGAIFLTPTPGSRPDDHQGSAQK
jgi:hypothetical protein